MEYFVSFTENDKSVILHKTPDKAEAVEFAKTTQSDYKAQGKHGMLTVYTLSTERGKPMQKCFEFFEV